jgi:hypothetical protein
MRKACSHLVILVPIGGIGAIRPTFSDIDAREVLMGGGFQGPPHFRWGLWLKKKQMQVLIRTHLSHFLAAILAMSVVVREEGDLVNTIHRFTLEQWGTILGLVVALLALVTYIWKSKMQSKMHFSRHFFHLAIVAGGAFLTWLYWSQLWTIAQKIPFRQWGIFLLALATILAAAWEFFGNKLSVSPQEVRFALGVRGLLEELQNFCFTGNCTNNTSLADFLKKFLGITSFVSGGHFQVESDFMLSAAGW